MLKVSIDVKLLVMGAFLCLFIFRECSHSSELDKKDSDFEIMQDFHSKRDSANLAKIKLDAADSIKANQIIVEYENLSKALKEELRGYKNGASLTETKVVTVLESVEMEIHDTIFIDKSRLSIEGCHYSDSLLKEFRNKKSFFTFKDDWLNIVGQYTYDKVLLDTVSLKNEFDVILGYKKEKWYKRRNQVVELKSYSPYAEIVYLNNIIVKDRKKLSFLNSKKAYFLYGALGSFLYLKTDR